MHCKKNISFILIFFFTFLLQAGALAQASFQGIGDLPGGNFHSRAWGGVSADVFGGGGSRPRWPIDHAGSAAIASRAAAKKTTHEILPVARSLKIMDNLLSKLRRAPVLAPRCWQRRLPV